MDSKGGASSSTSPKPSVPQIYGTVKQEGFVEQNQTLVSPTHPCCVREASALLSEVTLLHSENSNKQTQTYPLQTAAVPCQCKLTAETIQLLGSDSELLLHYFLKPTCTSIGVLPHTLPNLLNWHHNLDIEL